MKLPITSSMTSSVTSSVTAVLAAAALSVAGLLAAPAQALTAEADAAARDTTYAAPTVGSCHAYTFKQSTKRAETSAPVDCAAPHTGLTLAVTTVRSLKSDRAVARGAQKCDRTVRGTVGSLLPSTAFSTRFLLPNKAEAKQGARWLRCDIVLLGGRATLAPLPVDYLASPPTDATALCAVTQKKVTTATVCSSRHDYRYTTHYKARGKRYPGDTKLLRSVIVTCAKKVSTPKKFWAFYPDQSEWNAGYRQVSCLSHARA